MIGRPAAGSRQSRQHSSWDRHEAAPATCKPARAKPDAAPSSHSVVPPGAAEEEAAEGVWLVTQQEDSSTGAAFLDLGEG